MIDLITFSNQLQELIYENRMLREENRYLKEENKGLNDFIAELNLNMHNNIKDLIMIPFNNIANSEITKGGI